MAGPIRPIIVLTTITKLFAGLLILSDILPDPPGVMGAPGSRILDFTIFIQEFTKKKNLTGQIEKTISCTDTYPCWTGLTIQLIKLILFLQVQSFQEIKFLEFPNLTRLAILMILLTFPLLFLQQQEIIEVTSMLKGWEDLATGHFKEIHVLVAMIGKPKIHIFMIHALANFLLRHLLYLCHHLLIHIHQELHLHIIH